jgi:hypothetical protein
VYQGAGLVAVFCAVFDLEDADQRHAVRLERDRRIAEAAEARQSERRSVRNLRDRLAVADRAASGWHRRTGRLAEAMLRLWGFHRHCRGSWRRRRGMSTDLATRPDPTELDRLVAAGDVRTLERLLYRAEVALYQRAEEGTLNRGGIEEGLLQTLGPGFGRAEKEAMLAEARLIARELAPPGSSPAESLLADRAAVEWLSVRLLELDRADMLHRVEDAADAMRTTDHRAPPKPDAAAFAASVGRRLELIDRALSRASARLERSLVAIQKVRRLKLPVVIAAQVNVDARRTAEDSGRADPFDRSHRTTRGARS